MKKRMYRVICGALALLLAAALPGCSRKMTVEELIEKMEAASEAEDIMSADWTMNMEMGISMDLFGVDSTMDLSMSGEGNTLTNTSGEEALSYTSAVIGMELFGTSFSMDMEVYTQTDAEQNTTTYTGMDGTWTKSTASAEEADTAELEELLEKYQASFVLAEEKVTYSEENVSCYELQAELAVDDLTEYLESYLEELDLAELMDVSALNGRVFTIKMYVEESTYLLRYVELALADVSGETSEAESEDVSGTAAESDVAAESDTAEETSAESAESEEETSEDVEYSFDVLSVTMDLSYPEEGEIVIPEEALNAEEVTGDEALDGLLGDDTEDGYEEGVPTSENSGSQYDELTSPELLKEYAEGDADAVLLDESGVTVAVTRIYTDGDDRLYVDLDLTNGTEEDICIYSLGAAVNHSMAPDSSIYEEVAAGETVESVLYIESLSDLSVEEIGSVSVMLSAVSLSDYDTVLDSPELELVLDADAAVYQVDESLETIYEDDYVQIIVTSDWEDDTYTLELPLCIINKTETDLSMGCETIASSGEEVSAILYADLFAGSCIYTSLSVESGDAASEALEALSDLTDVTFQLFAYDMVTFEDVFTTDEITVTVSETGASEV
ncbi:MAG: hypothetical protein LUE23_10535 [Lachnospiraceae bacterium]|nr:hypothetical protein [Lachnospiraceae bacterium]